MLTIPTKGFAKSVNKHNLDLNVFCDWIEGSLLFNNIESSVSQIDIVDVLIEEERYVEQDFAFANVKNAWLEINRRVSWMGTSSTVQVRKMRIQRSENWQNYPAYVFCILLSLAPYYDWWKEDNYNEQGELFELVTEASFKAQFENWEVYRTGWSKSQPVRLRDIAIELSDRLKEDLGDIDTWDEPHAKELGLDMLCYRHFPDIRQGIPIYMMQCASGHDWDIKLHTPDLNKWKNIIHFKSCPVKAFATPFAFSEKEYRRCVATVHGLFLERCRLLAANKYNEFWLSDTLKDRLIAWSEPRVDELLARSK